MAFFATTSRKASRLAIAAAIMGIGAFGVTAIDTPAYAQKKTQANYSEGFVKAYGPLDAALKADAPDYAALRTQAIGIEGTVKTDDDRFAYGSTLYSIAEKLKDRELQFKAMEMMLNSGKTPAEAVPQYTFISGQLAYNLENWDVARQRLQEAIALGYEAENAEKLIANSYSLAGDVAGSLAYFTGQIDETIAAGGTPDNELLRRTFSIAYNNDMPEEAAELSMLLAKYYPSKASWGDAIAVQRNFGDYDEAELLDLLRLLRATDAMREERDFIDYLNFANFRRLPAESLAVAEAGLAKGLVDRNDPVISEVLSGTPSLSKGLRADLAALERDARASGVASDAIAAGNAYLNFDQPAKAAELYEFALTQPGVDQSLALTRLGMAQAKAGDAAAATATLAKVQGDRAPIARLWATYAQQQASGGMGNGMSAGTAN